MCLLQLGSVQLGSVLAADAGTPAPPEEDLFGESDSADVDEEDAPLSKRAKVSA